VVPHAPQLLLSVCVLTQAPVHTDCPPGHAQRPISQLWPVTQAVPQAPQLAASVWTSTQIMRPPVMQMRFGVVHEIAHAPLTQSWPEGQAVAHAPQLAGSLAVSTQRPMQSVWPVGHAQRPAWQL
jgi:hypothetical protein